MTVLARVLAIWVGASFLTCICLAYLGYRRNSNQGPREPGR